MGDIEPKRQVKKRLPRPLIALFVIAAAGTGAFLLLRQQDTSLERHYTGYVISDNIYMASPISGTVLSIAVKRGQRLEKGTSLFQIDPTSLNARIDRTKAQIQEAQAQNAVQKSESDSAAAAQRLAASDLERLLAADRVAKGTISQQDIDSASEKVSQTQAAVASAENRIAASKAFIESNQANLRDLERQLAELSPVSPVWGRVEEVIYKPGEWAPANAAVISIVPDEEIKIRFYVPQSKVSEFAAPAKVAFTYDGGPAGLTAVVDFVSTRPEYTPPVIYSVESRDKLVFMIEAVPANPTELIVGQPIDVMPIVSDGKE